MAPQPWVQDVIKRYLGTEENKHVQREPLNFQFDRAPFDPSAYYGSLGTLRNISQAGSRVTQQRVANQREIDRQKEIEALRQQAIDLSNIQPKFTGGRGASSPAGLGTKKGKYGAPLSGYRQTSGYGPRRSPTAGASSNHRGVDLAAASGTPIYATHNGTVSSAGWNVRSGYGYSVTINAGNGVQTFYGHNSRNTVKPGQQVRKGQVIGYVGSTGVSTGPHLHYGVMINGNWVNPSGYY